MRAIIHHTVLHPGLQQTAMQSLKYACSFVAFVPDPEVVLKNASAKLLTRGASKPYVVIYWGICATLITSAFLVWFRKRERIPAFFKYAAFEILLVCALFYYWTLKMTGPLFNFNGHFFFSVQLFGLFLLTAVVLNGLRLECPPRRRPRSLRVASDLHVRRPEGLLQHRKRRARDKFSREAPPSERRFDLPPYFCAV